MLDLTYRDLDSSLHRLGIPVKVLLFGLLAILSLLYSDLAYLGGVILACLLLSLAGRVGRKSMAFLRFFLLFSLLVLFINLVANQSGENMVYQTTIRFYWWEFGFRITLESISAALRMVMRLLALVLAFLLFTLTTKPEAMLRGFSRLGSFSGLGTLLGLSYRFLPTLALDGARIRDSLRTRGVRFDEGSRLERIRSYASLGLPLIVNSLDRSLQLAEAMESRGYGRATSDGRRPLRLSLADALASTYVAAIGTALVLLYGAYGLGKATLFCAPGNAFMVPILIIALLIPALRGGGKA